MGQLHGPATTCGTGFSSHDEPVEVELHEPCGQHEQGATDELNRYALEVSVSHRIDGQCGQTHTIEPSATGYVTTYEYSARASEHKLSTKLITPLAKKALVLEIPHVPLHF